MKKENRTKPAKQKTKKKPCVSAMADRQQEETLNRKSREVRVRVRGLTASHTAPCSTVTLLRQAKGKHSIPLTERVKAGQRGGVIK